MVRNNNFPEAGPSTKENPTTDHENVSITKQPAVDPLQQCLRTTIENMGPETPNFNSTVTETEDSLITTVPPCQSQQSGANCNMEFAELYMVADGSFVSNSSNLEFASTDASLMSNIPASLAEYNGNRECPGAYTRTSSMAARQSGTYVKPCCQCSGEIVDLLAKVKKEQGIQRVSRLDRPKFCRWFRNKSKKRNQPLNEYYQMDMTQPEDEHSPPRRVVFNLIEEFPKPQSTTKGTNTWHVVHDVTMQAASKDFNGGQVMQQDDPTQCKTMKDRSNERARAMSAVEDSVKCFQTIYKKNENIEEKIKRCDCNVSTRVDVYYFDHGNAAYLRTTDNVPLIRAEIIADQTEDYTTKFWGEIFGTVHIGVSFITSFFLQFVRFILQAIVRPLTVGLIQITSDYCFKPCLATLFNAVIQPPLICCYNTCTSLRDICDPIAEGIGYFVKEAALYIKAFRLVEIRNGRVCKCNTACKCALVDKETETTKEKC